MEEEKYEQNPNDPSITYGDYFKPEHITSRYNGYITYGYMPIEDRIGSIDKVEKVNKPQINEIKDLNNYMISDKEISDATYTLNDIFIKKLNYHKEIKLSDRLVHFVTKNDRLNIIHGIVQGIIYKEKVIDIRDIKPTDVFKEAYKLIIAYKKEDRYKFIKNTDIITKGVILENPISAITKIYPIKITGFELSGAVFGLRPTKETLVGNEYLEYTIEKGFSKQLKKETYYVTIPYKERNIKFCIEDIEFIRPSLKGYNFPKNKIITTGSTVRLKKDKDRVKLVVVNIITDKVRKGNSIVSVYNPLINKEFNIYQKHLKLIC